MDIQAENKRNLEFRNQQWQFFQSHPYFFRSHAGGGFATGNQENTYFVSLGWSGIISLVLANVSFDDDDARSDDHVQQIQP